MPYTHLTDACFSETIGEHGIGRGCFDALLEKADGALAILRSRYEDGSLPLLRLPEAREDLERLEPVAARYRERYRDVVLIGTGGSSLGGQTLCNLAEPGTSPRLHFFDNIDPHSLDTLLTSIDPLRTGFLVVSKSGSTAETLSIFLICLAKMRESLGEAAAEHFVAITEPVDNVLRRICAEHGIAALDHDPGVGGRYSVLSLTGLLPAMIAGLDAGAVRDGAKDVLASVLGNAAPLDVAPAVGAAISIGLAQERNVSTTVLMPYADRLADLGLWYRQLWAESLGKDGKGTTPVKAIGTVDQHSQFQLYLDGPRDKMFTIVMLDVAGRGEVISPDLARDGDLAYLAGRTLGDLMDAEQRATAETLIRHQRPTRIIGLEALDERAMGALFMHFMLETIIAAHLLGVDPFNQPAVEEGKVLARRYLSESDGG